MLIDATHPEETRVVVVDGTKVEEFDFETANRRQISGNIYLARVTRVEPSLQAAFVDYGGNRHGFLAFSEIHPDYYQIPAADREALKAEELAYAQAQEAEENARPAKRRSRAADAAGDDQISDDQSSADDEAGERAPDEASDRDEDIESIAEEDVTEEIRVSKKARPRRYKIQEVIKARQIMLVQVVKEERGNKGAALTTYLSLAGRYCVLMPNTARGGGISRKITNAADRKKLKDIAAELDVPQGAGLIIRTAGSQRTRTEIRRDYEYLLRLWEQIREVTFKSIAPAAIYEEGDLIKRSIRDLYSKEIEEVLVEGERGYRVAKDFMKMIMPSHAKNVKHYVDPVPLFARYQVESYLAAMFNPVVQLKSGGYIVIGVTEALVAIDVNSGRATKEGSIEETALKTNLEAADEVARQLRLRDLAGLIVIDFIDMEERKNNAAVEKRMKERLKSDRARMQIGRISGFGLMEMSRQRLRPGMLESTTQPCAHCHGTGLIRSDDSLALSILRAIEEEGTRKRSREVLVKAPVSVANFLINAKREHIANIEARYGLSVRIEADPTLISPDFAIEKFKTATRLIQEIPQAALSVNADLMAQIDDEEDDPETTADTAADNESDLSSKEADQDNGTSDEDEAGTASADETGEGGRSRRRRRRRRRKPGDRAESDATGTEDGGADEAEDRADAVAAPQQGENDTAEPSVESSEPSDTASKDAAREAADAESDAEARPRRGRSRGRRKSARDGNADAQAAVEGGFPDVVDLRDARDDIRADALPGVNAHRDGDDQADAAAETGATDRDVAEPAQTDAPQGDAGQVAVPDLPEDEPQAQAVQAGRDEIAQSAAEMLAAPAEAPLAAETEGAENAADDQAAPAPEEAATDSAETANEPGRPKRRGWWSFGA